MDRLKTFDEFQEYIIKNIKHALPAEYGNASVSIEQVVKNNDTVLDALVIRRPNINIAPAIYINDFWQQYKDGVSISYIMDSLSSTRVDYDISKSYVGINDIGNYEMIQDIVSCKLISKDTNADYLSDKPYTDFMDLAVVYYLDLSSKNNAISDLDEGISSASATIPVTSSLIEKWGVSVEELHKKALQNLDVINPIVIKSMLTVLTEHDIGVDLGADDLSDMSENMMYVVSNERLINGASALLSEATLEIIYDGFGRDFIVFPSSTREVLVLATDEIFDRFSIDNMVKEVNIGYVQKEEILSDHAYVYNSLHHKLETSAEYEANIMRHEVDSLRAPYRAIQTASEDRNTLLNRDIPVFNAHGGR